MRLAKVKEGKVIERIEGPNPACWWEKEWKPGWSQRFYHEPTSLWFSYSFPTSMGVSFQTLGQTNSFSIFICGREGRNRLSVGLKRKTRRRMKENRMLRGTAFLSCNYLSKTLVVITLWKKIAVLTNIRSFSFIGVSFHSNENFFYKNWSAFGLGEIYLCSKRISPTSVFIKGNSFCWNVIGHA